MKTTNWQTKALTLFIAAVALWLTASCGKPSYEDILGLEPCVDDFDFGALAIFESISAPFAVGVLDDWSLDVREHSYRGSNEAVRDAGRVVLEHEERFKSIPELNWVAVNRLSLRDEDTGNVEQWTVKHGIIAYIDFPWSGRIEDWHRWLPGCLNGYPVLAAKNSAFEARDYLVPIRRDEE